MVLDNAAMPPAYRVKVHNCANFVDVYRSVNLQHCVTKSDKVSKQEGYPSVIKMHVVYKSK